MYFNRFTGRLVIDAFDYFLISSFITSSLILYLKKYLLEKSSMERLKNDIINKLKFIESSKSPKSTNNLGFKKSKIQKIYRFALDSRGGADYDFDYQLAERDRYSTTGNIRSN
jgi:hypothetical protein